MKNEKYDNRVNTNDGSFLKDYYFSVIPFLQKLLLSMYAIGIILSVWIYFYDVEIGSFQDLTDYFAKTIQGCQIKNVVAIVCVIFVFAIIYFLPEYIIRLVYKKEFVFDRHCVRILYNGKEIKCIQYEAIAKLIKKRKLYIKSGRIYIPCSGGDIPVRLDNDMAKFPSDTFRKLARMSGKKLPAYDINHQITRSGFPYALRNLFGGISAGIGILISFLILVFEWNFTYEKIMEAVFINFMFWLAVISVGIAFISRIIFYIKGVIAYWEYRNSIKVCLSPIFIDMLILIAWFGAYWLYRCG